MDKLQLGERHAALRSGDSATLDQILAEDFVGDLTTPGLPDGYGAAPYRGREAMKRDGWGRVGASFALAPQTDEVLESGDYIVGCGRYVGTAVATGKKVEARFAHF